MTTEIKKSKKTTHAVPNGKVFIQSTFNNTIITITDLTGNVIAWSSSGNCGFKGTKKGTPFAAGIAAEKATKIATSNGMRSVECYVSGPGSGRETAIRTLQLNGLKISIIKDITPMPHNGCRAQKPRRV